MNYLILYSYFEQENSKKNLEFFLKNAVFDKPNYHYFIVINGDVCSVNLKETKNLKILKRKNEGFDFGGWGHSLKNINVEEFDYFIFINSTCIGPFIPRYIPKKLTWIELFTSNLDDKFKLCGPTINYLPKHPERSEHIQSFAFSTDLTGVKILIKNNIFSPIENIERKKLIENHELGMSKIILNNGYRLFAFQLSENINENIFDKKNLHDDIHYNNKYYGDTINPIEVMFIKSKRINTKILENYINFNL